MLCNRNERVLSLIPKYFHLWFTVVAWSMELYLVDSDGKFLDELFLKNIEVKYYTFLWL